MILSILILSTIKRKHFLDYIVGHLNHQKKLLNEYGYKFDMEINIHDGIETIGEKRNLLLQNAKGKYTCFIDDDDEVASDYLKLIIDALDNPDCTHLSLLGVMTTDGKNPEVFEHSTKYKEWKTWDNTFGANIKHERYPNHLNVIRADIAKQFKFPETNFGEDKVWSDALHQSGLLKNEVYIDQVLYYYQYRSKK